MAAETTGVNGTAGTGRQNSRPPSPLLEAVLSLELSHPNIIKTYKYETRTVQVGNVQTVPSRLSRMQSMLQVEVVIHDQ